MDTSQRSELYSKEQEAAIAAVAGWVTDRRVLAAVLNSERRARAAEIVAPLDRYLDQAWPSGVVRVLEFAMSGQIIGHLYPDGSIDLGPFAADGFPFTDHERDDAVTVLNDLRRLVLPLAQSLADAGVKLDPGWLTDQVVLGEMLLVDLGPLCEARELAERLWPIGLSRLSFDARSVSHRDDRRSEGRSDAEEIRWDRQQQLRPVTLPPAYNAGKPRAPSRVIAVRRQALGEVLAKHPTATASEIHERWGGTPGTSGGLFMERLKALSKGDSLLRNQLVKRWSEDTLARDLTVIRADDSD